MERILLEYSVRVALIGAVTGIMLRVLRIRRAAVQHGAWVCVTLAMLALPAWMVWGPKASLPLLPSDPIVVTKAAPATSPVRDEALPVTMTAESGPMPTVAVFTWTRDRVAVGAYLLVAGIFLLRLAIGTIQARLLNRASCSVPVTVGLLRPRIVLPESATEWSAEQLNAVIAHERAHVRRRDPLFQWIALLNRAVFWFHPLSWWLVGRLSALAEEACDAAALEDGHDPREYSMCLLEMAREANRAGARINAVAMAMPGSHLPQRIKKIAAGMVAPRVTRARLVCAAIVCAVPAVLFAAGSLDHAPQVLLLPPLPLKAVPQPPELVAQVVAPAGTDPSAQQQENLKFEVASIRPAAPSGGMTLRGGPESPDPERLTYANVTLKVVMANAYDVESDQISGPGWLDTARFDIEAKIPRGAIKEQFRAMLANLLAERFHLAFHREKKEFTVYELQVGKGGPKLQDGPAPSVDGNSTASSGRGGPVDGKGFPAPPPHQTAQSARNGVARMAGNQITMAAFAQFLRFPMGFMDGPSPGGDLLRSARVVDKTGLTGEYRFTLEYEWPGPKRPDADPGDFAPSLFTALQQQLGLRLERTKTPLDVLIIDGIDKAPTEN